MSRTTTAIWVIFIGVGGARICRSLSLAMFVLRASWSACSDYAHPLSPSIDHARRCRKGRPGAWSGAFRAPSTAALQFQQPDRGQLVGDQNIEESAVQCAENRRGLVQPTGHADHLGNLRQIGQLDADAAVVDRQ